MKSIAINGVPRESLGKKNAKHLRTAGNVPCLLYGGKTPVHFTASEKEFKNLVYTPNTYLVDLSIGGTAYKAVMRDIQFHPVSERIEHIDFFEIVPDRPVVVQIPVKITGTAIGVREGGQLLTKIRKLRVKALPARLPDSIEVNVEHLLLSKSVKVGDIKIPDVEILDSPNNIITVVKKARVIVEETPVVAATGAAPAAGAEGAAPAGAEGAAPAAVPAAEKKEEKKK